MSRLIALLALVTVIASIVPSPGEAQDCADYAGYLRLESSSFLFGTIQTVETGDGLVYYSHGGNMVRVGRPVASTEGPEYVSSISDSLTSCTRTRSTPTCRSSTSPRCRVA